MAVFSDETMSYPYNTAFMFSIMFNVRQYRTVVTAVVLVLTCVTCGHSGLPVNGKRIFEHKARRSVLPFSHKIVKHLVICASSSSH